MKHDFPSVKFYNNQINFEDGKFCQLPIEYKRESNKKTLENFYKNILDSNSSELLIGEDVFGFNYFKIELICYVGLICDSSKRSKSNNLKKKYSSNKFQLDYIINRIKEENKLMNYQEYIPISVVSQNLHEIRGLNGKVTDNLDSLLRFDNEEKWDEQFDAADPYLRKIYVANRLIKFILDNTKFYNPNFWDTLSLNKDRYFNPHRCISKIVKIYRNDFKKEKPDISFQGNSIRKLQGNKEYFEILIKIFVENALKYSSIRSIGPQIKLIENNKTVVIEIRSFGNLIPNEDKKNIFLKGYRSNINNLSIEGTGMGLYNAKKLIEKFGGSIEFSTKNANSDDNKLIIGWNIFTLTFENTFDADKSAFV